jgi:hypothetical protein
MVLSSGCREGEATAHEHNVKTRVQERDMAQMHRQRLFGGGGNW